MFKKDLDKDVKGDTSGNFAKLLLALVQVRFDIACLCDSYNYNYRVETDLSCCVFIFVQTKRAEPSAVVDYEKIDEDARVSFPCSTLTLTLSVEI